MRRCLIALLLAIAVGRSAPLGAQLTDVEAKAAFLLNVARFVDWPAAEPRTLTLCVAAEPALFEAIEQSGRGRLVSGRELKPRRLVAGDDPRECQILFITSLAPFDAAELLRRSQGPVLTIGETLQFLRDGGMMRVFIEQQRIRFQVDHKVAAAAGLKISSQLLKLSAR